MSDANDKAGASTMPVTGSGCGIRPSKEAMEVDFEVDFSKAKELLKTPEADDPKTQTNQSAPQ